MLLFLSLGPRGALVIAPTNEVGSISTGQREFFHDSACVDL